MCSLKREKISFFSSKKHIAAVRSFLDNYHFIKPKSLKTSLNNFSGKKDIDIRLLLFSNDVSTL